MEVKRNNMKRLLLFLLQEIFFPIHPAAAWTNAAFSAFSLFSFCSRHMCILHAVEHVLCYFSVQKGLERKTTARGERWVLYKEETSLFITLLRSPPANKYSWLDLLLSISNAKVVRHRSSKWKLLSVCVSCGLISSVTSTQEKESFMDLLEFFSPFFVKHCHTGSIPWVWEVDCMDIRCFHND